MSTTPRPPQIIPYLFYRDVPAALEFLTRAFGFKEEMRHATPSGGMHGEASLQGQLVMMGQGGVSHGLKTPAEAGGATMGVFVYIDDVDRHYERAKAAGHHALADAVERGRGDKRRLRQANRTYAFVGTATIDVFAALFPESQAPAPVADEAVRTGKLLRVVEDLEPTTPGVLLYDPSRKQMTPKLRAFIDHLKSRSGAVSDRS